MLCTSRFFTWPCATLMLLLCVLPSTAQSFDRPGAGDEPTILKVNIVALDIDEIDSAKQNFTANLFFMVRWQDDRLAHEEPGDRVLAMNEAWEPDIQFANQQKVLRTFPERLLVTPSGEVIYRQRVWGSFSQKLDLTEFPFDRHRFEVMLVAATPDVATNEIMMVQDEAYESGLSPDFTLPDWDIESWDVGTFDYNPLDRGEGVPGFVFAFEARRYVGYYLFKLILPLILIVLMSWIVFWIDPTEMGTQVSVAITSMLTLIAYRFMVGSSLPTISYLTRMDLFILCSTLLVFITLIEVVVTGTLARREHVETARRLDRASRLLFPLAFAGIAFATLVT